MDRFVVMIWNQADPTRQSQVNAWSEMLQRQSPKWKRAIDRPGLRVFSYHHRGDGPVVTRWQGEEGIVIGVLFERGHEMKGRVQSLDSRAAGRVIASGGDELIQRYWGNYVALWCDPETRETTILRDPCGAVACFMTRQKGVELLFADVEDVADFPGLSFTIDWIFLQAYVHYLDVNTGNTGLKEAKELLAGQRMRVAADGEKSFSSAWNAAKVASDPNPQSFDAARDELRATAEACFTGWGKAYRNTIIRLSGGLDSSVVLTLLRHASDAKITAMHLVGVDYEAYELKMARLSAAKAGVELLELEIPTETNLRRALDFPRTMRPSLQTISMEVDDVMVGAAEKLGADSFMGGQGGDQLFMQQNFGAHALADYVQLKGFGPMFWQVAYETAMMRKSSVWKALGDAADSALLHRTWRPHAFLNKAERVKDRLLRQEVIEAIPDTYISHPWLKSAVRLPRGMAERVKEVIELHTYHTRHGYACARDDMLPLFCQPLTEFSLRTPSFVFGQDGLDRALERRAFADLIPEPVFHRTGKGGVSRTVLSQWPRNIGFCRELILGGAFVAQGWIDAALADRAVSLEFVSSGRGAISIYTMFAVEAWVARWRSAGVRVAA
jgi:asparagine synthase (glutamine-hydrolysing)